MIILLDHREGQPSIHELNYVHHFKEDRTNYSDPATCVVGSQNTLGLGSWEEILEQCTTGYNTVPSHVSVSHSQLAHMGVAHEPDNVISGKLLPGENAKDELGNSLPNYSTWQVLNSISFFISSNSLYMNLKSKLSDEACSFLPQCGV